MHYTLVHTIICNSILTDYFGVVQFISSTGKVKILPEIPSIRAEVNRLKNRGINIIIALGHSGFEVDQVIAREVEHIDLVVGGHSHTLLYNGKILNIFYFSD